MTWASEYKNNFPTLQSLSFKNVNEYAIAIGDVESGNWIG